MMQMEHCCNLISIAIFASTPFSIQNTHFHQNLYALSQSNDQRLIHLLLRDMNGRFTFCSSDINGCSWVSIRWHVFCAIQIWATFICPEALGLYHTYTSKRTSWINLRLSRLSWRRLNTPMSTLNWYSSKIITSQWLGLQSRESCAVSIAKATEQTAR